MNGTITKRRWSWLVGLAVAWGMTASAPAQNSSLHWRHATEASRDVPDTYPAEELPLTLRDVSWTHAPLPPPREIKKHDIISVRVDVLARMQADGELRRRKNARYDARLNDWVIFHGLRWMKPSAQNEGDPRMRGELRSEYRSLGEVETSESLAFNLAVEIVDIRPNGNLVLEGRSKIVLNDEVWGYVLSGLCRPESIGPNNVVLSRDIIDLDIRKVETGSVAAGYQRGWFQKLFDLFQPF
jgi:flagellar L-ring protein FlgH